MPSPVCQIRWLIWIIFAGYNVVFCWRVDVNEDDDLVRVVVGLNNDDTSDEQSFRLQNKVHGTLRNSIHRAHAITMTIPRSKVPLLLNDTDVDYFYEDNIVYPFVEQKEEQGWGIRFIDADNTFIPPPAHQQARSRSDNDDDACFKVCVVDGGLQTAHPDIVSFV